MAKARRGYGEGAFFRTPDGYWHYRLSVGNYANGKRKFKEFKGKNRIEIALRVGTYKRQYGYTCPDERQNMFLSAFILDWAENVKRNEIKEASYNRLLSTVKVHICPALGGVRLKDLTGEMIQKDLINSMRDQICPQTKRPYSLSSIKKAFVYLNACMEYAVMIDVLPKNPCRSVTIPTKSQRPPRAYRFFNDVEVARFITACQRSTCTTVWALEVAMYTGLREGELCALRPADIDLAGKRIYVHATLIKRKAEGNGAKSEFIYQPETKNRKMRIVPLNQRALELFRDRLKQCPRGSNAYLVTLKDKGFNLPTLNKHYKKICASAGLESVKGAHDLRHTFDSKLIRAGTDIKVVSELLGHASVSFTYNTYVHLLEDQKEQAVTQMAWQDSKIG